jgi:hypothetical protein
MPAGPRRGGWEADDAFYSLAYETESSQVKVKNEANEFCMIAVLEEITRSVNGDYENQPSA